jgi:hypothetical protein
MGRQSSLKKCGSAPNIAALSEGGSPLLAALAPLYAKQVPAALLGYGGAMAHRASVAAPMMTAVAASTRRQSSSVRRGCSLLSPHPLQRQALSVDYTNMNMYSPLMFQPRPAPHDSPKSTVERTGSVVCTILPQYHAFILLKQG